VALIITAVLAITAISAIALTTTLATTTLADESTVRFKLIAVLGKGIAISGTDSSIFKLIRVGIARVTLGDTETALGVLFIDHAKYVLKDVTIGEGNVSGDVYLNTTKVGTFSASTKTLGDDIVWFGTLTLDSQTWNVYLLEGHRRINAAELGEEASEKCGENPQACAELAKGIGRRFCEKIEDRSCREKIQEFCEKNPDDPRCVAMYRSFCKNNIEDSRCREELKEFCSENPTNDRCEKFCKRFPRICGESEETTTTTTSTTSTTSTTATTSTTSATTTTTTTTPATTTTTTTSAATTTTTTAS